MPYLQCAKMTWTRILKTLRRSTRIDPQLVIVGYDLTGHYFNELLGYRSAAGILGLALRIITARSVEPRLAAELLAEPAIEPMPSAWDILPQNIVDQVIAFADSDDNLASLWTAIAQCDLRSTDMLLFPISRPLLILRVGEWLAQRRPGRRPSVFFRFTGGEIVERTNRANQLCSRSLVSLGLLRSSQAVGSGTHLSAGRHRAPRADADPGLLPARFPYAGAKVSCSVGLRAVSSNAWNHRLCSSEQIFRSFDRRTQADYPPHRGRCTIDQIHRQFQGFIARDTRRARNGDGFAS